MWEGEGVHCERFLRLLFGDLRERREERSPNRPSRSSVLALLLILLFLLRLLLVALALSLSHPWANVCFLPPFRNFWKWMLCLNTLNFLVSSFFPGGFQLGAVQVGNGKRPRDRPSPFLLLAKSCHWIQSNLKIKSEGRCRFNRCKQFSVHILSWSFILNGQSWL